ncbi:hypothetical protein [Streptomyces sp. NBC_00059]|uniref:hypothetical protein n=1 Tax=Streptomyces sp. NBC_00059 TaxID=2975635 RepID=UPI00224DD631|nr:hypothetical protein [Streptomyces sp. NBC_00059]MCX5413551.1 hypothetical protein [Streptomyces sp. NBC_00059]
MNHFKRALAGGAASLALASGLLAAGAGPASAAQSDCPVGAVCIYPEGKSEKTTKPTNIYYSRGVHKLYNQENFHWVYNNQTDGWTVRLCTGGNGTGCGTALQPDYLRWADLSPINSILIEP